MVPDTALDAYDAIMDGFGTTHLEHAHTRSSSSKSWRRGSRKCVGTSTWCGERDVSLDALERSIAQLTEMAWVAHEEARREERERDRAEWESLDECSKGFLICP